MWWLVLILGNMPATPSALFAEGLPNGASYWFEFTAPLPGQGYQTTETRTALQLDAAYLSDVAQAFALMPRPVFIQMKKRIREDKSTHIGAESLVAEWKQQFDFTCPVAMMPHLDTYGPQFLHHLMRIFDPVLGRFEWPEAKLYPEQTAFSRLAPQWWLGSVPPSLHQQLMALFPEADPFLSPEPFLVFLLACLFTFLKQFFLWIVPWILLGIVFGLIEAYGRMLGFPAWVHHGLTVGIHLINDLISAVPRFLLIILFVILFRQFGRPLELWMIALPLGLSSLPPVTRELVRHMREHLRQDRLALRRSQGFSHGATLLELFRFRLYTIPLLEMMAQLMALIYADTLIQFMVRMSDGVMSGINSPHSLGYALVNLSFAISQSSHYQFSIFYEIANYWLPGFFLILVFVAIPLCLHWLNHTLARRFIL
jgi:hypothetical protein